MGDAFGRRGYSGFSERRACGLLFLLVFRFHPYILVNRSNDVMTRELGHCEYGVWSIMCNVLGLVELLVGRQVERGVEYRKVAILRVQQGVFTSKAAFQSFHRTACLLCTYLYPFQNVPNLNICNEYQRQKLLHHMVSSNPLLQSKNIFKPPFNSQSHPTPHHPHHPSPHPPPPQPPPPPSQPKAASRPHDSPPRAASPT